MELKTKDKYHSMLRSYDRLKKIETNNGTGISNTDSKDAVEDFFNQCYHLKDWIKKDTTIPKSVDVENFVKNSEALSLAADYCNTFKHGGLDTERYKSKSNKTIENILTHIKLDLTPQGFVATSRLEIIIDGEKYDAFEIATKCVEEWNDFIRVHKIDFSNP